METFKAKPFPVELEILSEPFVAYTPFGFHPFVQVKNLKDNKEGKIIISPSSLSRPLKDLMEDNSYKFTGLKISYQKESSDPKSKYIIKKI